MLITLAPVIATFTHAEHTFALPRAGQGLDGLRHLGPRADLAEYLASVPWPEGASLIEAPADSFTEGAALATASGRPSVIGWTGHIELWHGSHTAAWGRAQEIIELFETDDHIARCRVIRRYNTAYIAFTQTEQARFPDLTLTELAAFGHLAFDGEGGQLIRVAPATCTLEPAQ